MDSAVTVRLSTAAARATTPWLGGGGSTSEVVRSPATGDPFDWRVSIATVVEDGAFSALPGVDRRLMPLSPEGLRLEGVRDERFAQFEVAAFAGETAVSAVDVASPGLDLNLMLNRETVTGDLRHVDVDEQLLVAASGPTVVVLVSGALLYGGAILALHDALILDPGASAALVGSGSVAIAEIRKQR